MKRLRLLAATIAVACTAWSSRARATEPSDLHYGSRDRVLIAFTVNHGDFAESDVLRLRHAAEGLAELRARLVRAGRLRALPVVVEIMPAFWSESKGSAGIEVRSSCWPNEEAEEAPSPAPSPCYAISLLSPDDVHRWSRALLLSARDRPLPSPHVEVTDLAALEQQVGASAFGGVTRWVDPVRSPDGRLQLSTIWKDGELAFLLHDRPTGRFFPLEPLDGYLAARPSFSPSARYVAIASLRQVQVFDVIRRRTFQVPVPAGPSTRQIRLAFDARETSLRFVFDRELRTDHLAVSIDLATGEATAAVAPSDG